MVFKRLVNLVLQCKYKSGITMVLRLINLRHYLLAGFFSTWLPKIVLYFIIFLLMNFEGIVKDNAITEKHKNAAKSGLAFLPIIIY